MSEYSIGQDVIVESNDIFDGEAFIAAVDAETETLRSDSVYVDVRDRPAVDGEIALVMSDNVISLTEVFDNIDEHPLEEVRCIVKEELDTEVRESRRKA